MSEQGSRLKHAVQNHGMPPNGETGDDQADGETNGQSRGGLRPTKPRVKRRRGTDDGKRRGCKHSIRETVFERLRQTSIKRKKSMSDLVDDILDRNLPHFEIKQMDGPPAAE